MATVSFRQLEVAQEEEMMAEAASVEAVWAVEPSFLEHVIFQEVEAHIRERVS